MTNKYYLNKKDQAWLIENCAYEQDDMKQIQSTINKAKFLLYKGDELQDTITPKQALQMLGQDNFLIAVARAAFHFSCQRKLYNVGEPLSIFIDNYKMLEDISENLHNEEPKEEYKYFMALRLDTNECQLFPSEPLATQFKMQIESDDKMSDIIVRQCKKVKDSTEHDIELWTNADKQSYFNYTYDNVEDVDNYDLRSANVIYYTDTDEEE